MSATPGPRSQWEAGYRDRAGAAASVSTLAAASDSVVAPSFPREPREFSKLARTNHWNITMNAALRPFSVHVRYPGAETLLDTPSTYEIALLQLAKHLAEHRPVRTCANERRRRLFTRQRGRAQYQNTGHATGVIYCSNLCAKAQSERVRRARKRAEKATSTAQPETGAD